MNTMLLDLDTWDLLPDAYGNIAMASDPYSQAQDVASACRVFRGELWFDVSIGIPYFEEVLGYQPPLELLKQFYVEAALTVPGVVAAVCYFESIVGRRLTGQIQSTNVDGVINASGF